MVSNGIFIICVILALLFGATIGLFGASLCIVAKDNKEKLNITDNGKPLVESLRQLGKYSEFEPNYFLLSADRIEELENSIVRCKDCKYYKTLDKYHFCTYRPFDFAVTDNDFCSFGERKEK